MNANAANRWTVTLSLSVDVSTIVSVAGYISNSKNIYTYSYLFLSLSLLPQNKMAKVFDAAEGQSSEDFMYHESRLRQFLPSCEA